MEGGFFLIIRLTPIQAGLCIPSRKVNDVERVMRESSIYNANSKTKVLLLTGKTGTGKSTMVRLLADKLDLQLIEWDAECRVRNDPEYGKKKEKRKKGSCTAKVV
jgi:polynucleotide 5'-kinase involved in rRNA processing